MSPSIDLRIRYSDCRHKLWQTWQAQTEDSELEKPSIIRDGPLGGDVDRGVKGDKQKQCRKKDEVANEVQEVVKRELDRTDHAHVQAAKQRLEGEQQDPISVAAGGNSEVLKLLITHTSVTVRLLEGREDPVAIFRDVLERLELRRLREDDPPLCAAIMSLFKVTEHLLRGLRQTIDAK